MKKIFYISLVSLIFAYGFTTIQTADNCDKKTITANCKKKLKPYKYDSQKFTKVTLQNKLQLLEVEVPVFIGEKYRLIFNRATLPKSVMIRIFTKDKDSKKREPIYTSENETEDIIVYDVPRVRKLFVDYDVPMADSSNLNATGCAFLMVGYDK